MNIIVNEGRKYVYIALPMQYVSYSYRAAVEMSVCMCLTVLGNTLHV